jgi:hypothetical protein
MHAQLIFRVLVALVVAALFVVAGRSWRPARASQVATQSVAGLGETARR